MHLHKFVKFMMFVYKIATRSVCEIGVVCSTYGSGRYHARAFGFINPIDPSDKVHVGMHTAGKMEFGHPDMKNVLCLSSHIAVW